MQKIPIPKYPYLYLPSNLVGRIDTSNAKPWTLEDVGYLNQISEHERETKEYEDDFIRVKHLLIYNIAKTIKDDSDVFNYFNNPEKLNELLQFFLNKETNKYIICRQFLMHILRIKEFNYNIRETFRFHIISQNVPKLQQALEELNPNLFKEFSKTCF